METFAQRFNEVLKEKKLRQIDVANKTGIAPGTISNYAQGKYEPKGSNLEKIARALDVNEAWLAGYDVPRQNYDPLYNATEGRPIDDDEVLDPAVYNFLEVLELKLSHITDDNKREKALKALRSTLDLIEE
ncbi:MAG: helix-turn-helix transcriptional regulator [Solobacterium sp.]|nr:helix-turn-helix transcriptional regulator [Solobacterium sp.]